jgi:hypothetical protein
MAQGSTIGKREFRFPSSSLTNTIAIPARRARARRDVVERRDDPTTTRMISVKTSPETGLRSCLTT